MAKIAQGLFNSRISIERDDEIGLVLRGIQATQAKLGFDREEQKDTEKRVAGQRKLEMQKLANEFEGAVGEIIETVSSASSELEASRGDADDDRSAREGSCDHGGGGVRGGIRQCAVGGFGDRGDVVIG